MRSSSCTALFGQDISHALILSAILDQWRWKPLDVVAGNSKRKRLSGMGVSRCRQEEEEEKAKPKPKSETEENAGGSASF
jgi:hypothetical protein